MAQTIDEIDLKTWNKLEDSAIKAGYRDGISDGRESNFQNSFDEGYKQGFDTGFTLGFFKGVLSDPEDNKKCNDVLLSKTTRGNCQMCNNKNFEKEEIFKLKSSQTKSLEMLLMELKKKYTNIQYENKSVNSISTN